MLPLKMAEDVAVSLAIDIDACMDMANGEVHGLGRRLTASGTQDGLHGSSTSDTDLDRVSVASYTAICRGALRQTSCVVQRWRSDYQNLTLT